MTKALALRGGRTLALALLLIICWSVTHRYQGLGGDARLYAFQATARIHPALLHDLYLSNTSQDSYTIFSVLYAKCIELIGLQMSALLLAIAFKIWFFTAGWLLARRLMNPYAAFFAVVLLIVAPGEYGAFGVFRFAEDWLTARSLAEALVITALVCWFSGWRFCGLLIAWLAIFVHPLMALPGLLLLICLWFPPRLYIAGATAGILLALAVSLVASLLQASTERVMVIDSAWLEVVRERSQFLFLQLWRPRDWGLNARPFLSLSLSVLVIGDSRIRKLGASALVVGGAGLAVAFIASSIGPVSIFLQGQAWRWVWITSFLSILLLTPTLLALSRAQRCGWTCAFLVVFGWVSSPIYGAAWLACAVIDWLLRDHITPTFSATSRKEFPAWASKLEANIDHTALLRRIIGWAPLSMAISGVIGCGTRVARSTSSLFVLIGILVVLSLYCTPRAFRENNYDHATFLDKDFAEWRRVIPPSANVWVAPSRNSAAFAWFTLERPSYLTVDQSSGVVFSRATAIEVRRRAEVLLPLMDPDWRLLSSMSGVHSGAGDGASPDRSLTRDRLVSICADPQLNFVVAAENVGFEPLRRLDPGNRRGLYLYDCRLVLAPHPSA